MSQTTFLCLFTWMLEGVLEKILQKTVKKSCREQWENLEGKRGKCWKKPWKNHKETLKQSHEDYKDFFEGKILHILIINKAAEA